MAFDPLTAAMELGGHLIDKLIPDPQAKADATLKLVQMKQNGDLAELTAATDIAKAQIAVNQAEASSASFFVAAGRPAVIWVCALALFNDFVLRPFALFIVSTAHIAGVSWPSLDTAALTPLLTGLLGLGAMRTYEKVQSGKS